MDLLAAGKQSDAEKLVINAVKENPTARTVFFAGVLIRSRFKLDAADGLLNMEKSHFNGTLEAKASALIVAIDSDQSAEENLKKLDDLYTANKDDALLLWSVATECRQLKKTKMGIDRYATLLKKLDPGPVAAHQTYGNLLLDDHKAELALAQFDTAIELEPASSEYTCRGNALAILKRLDDAAAAYKTATELNPNDATPWTSWGGCVRCAARSQGCGREARQGRRNPQAAKAAMTANILMGKPDSEFRNECFEKVAWASRP